MASIQPFIHQKVVVLHQDSPVKQAAHVMRDRGIGCVMVADHQGHVVGVLTDRDLVTHVLADSGNGETPISYAMTPQPISVDENADVERAVRLMEEHGIRRVPVIRKGSGGAEKCVGIVTLDDLIASRLVDYYHLMRIVRAQILRRARKVMPGPKAPLKPASDLKPTVGDQQSVAAFYKQIADKMGEKAGLSRGQTEQATKTVLTAILRRLHHTGAMHLMLQLPRMLQYDLMDLQPGPDHTINSTRIDAELMTRFELDEPTAHLVATRICMAVEDYVDTKEIEQVKAQLPPDVRALFAARAGGAKEMKAA